VNVKEFQIEKKIAERFINVMTIAASNNHNGSSYSYNDNNSNRGTTQYRLKVIEQDGKFSYSEIRAVKGSGGSTDFTVFPNPSHGSAKVVISDVSEAVEIQLIDQMGRVIRTLNTQNSNTMEMNNLTSGMYMIRIVNKKSGEITTKKLSVVN
jgi:hypothetical protein